jgi:hypothetical protein
MCIPIARQRLGKHIPAEENAPNNRTSIARKRISKQVFSTIERLCFLRGLCRGVINGQRRSTVTLRVVGGDEKGSLKSETVKYGRESQGTRARERLRWQGPAAYIKDTRPLVREGAPQKQDRNCQIVIDIWSWAPHGARHQDLLTEWPSVAMWLRLRLSRLLIVT